MWNLVKIAVEPLVSETFASFGHVINTFEQRQPDKVKGGYATNAYPVLAQRGAEPKDTPGWYEANANRVPLSEGLERAHFAFHTDAGQSFYPSLHSPTVFLVGAIQDDIQAEELRAFYSEGDVGVCLHLGVWHTMPICVEGEDIYQTTRGDQDYFEHSVEIDFDLERGQSIAPDMANFNRG